VLTGLVTAPRGIGTLIAMLVIGRMMGKVDNRYIMAVGLVMTAVSLWWMTGFYLQMDSSAVIWSGVLQGFGTGAVYLPLSAIAFSTLPSALRNEGTAVFSLSRNIGSSIGISAVTTLLTRNTQIMHAQLAEHITPFGDAFGATTQALSSPEGLAGLNAAVTQQAAMIAYNNDFQLMLVMTIAALPLVLLLRPAKPGKSSEPMVIE
jgi:MFS transporter, DHA2 family, multidrug resistance protein